eukprot:6602023-Ditylum_brightwellii.AAC.1
MAVINQQGHMSLCTNAYNFDIKHNPQMISRGRQDLVLETKVANMEIKMGIMTEKWATLVKGGNYGQTRNN